MLLLDEAAVREAQPIYVSVGLAWEEAERTMIAQFLAAVPPETRLRPLASLSVDMTDIYAASHWAIQGKPPGYHTPDEEVYLPGRNVILLGKAGVFCAAANIGRLVLGTLDHNPFPDATPAFRSAMAAALSLGLAHQLSIVAPYGATSKADVIRRGAALHAPLALTLSCMQPKRPATGGRHVLHCGVCSKCRERHLAFVEAGIADPTTYADRQYVTSRADP